MNRIYLDPTLCSRYDVPYYDSGQLSVHLSSLRNAHDWDSGHQAIWTRLEEKGCARVSAQRSENDRPGWYILVFDA